MTEGRKRSGRGSRLSGRGVATRVRTAKGRKTSSTRWLQRQLNDPYVAEAKKLGFRSRAAFKLIEMDDRYRFLKAGGRVVDLGAAPGGWSQVAIERTGPSGHVVALDINAMDPLAGAHVLQADFLDPAAPQASSRRWAARPTSCFPTWRPRLPATRPPTICASWPVEAALDFAGSVLTPGGAFIARSSRAAANASC